MGLYRRADGRDTVELDHIERAIEAPDHHHHRFAQQGVVVNNKDGHGLEALVLNARAFQYF